MACAWGYAEAFSDDERINVLMIVIRHGFDLQLLARYQMLRQGFDLELLGEAECLAYA